MTSRILIFDHFMKPIADLGNIPTTPRGWVLDGYGKCEFSLSTADPKCTIQNLQFGNLVHITHIPSLDADGNLNGKLPDWTGIILPDQNWDEGVVHVTAYSVEALLAFRAMPYLSVKGTPKDIFTQIINFSHARAKNIIIQLGILDDISFTFSDDLRTNAYDHIGKLINDSGMDWDVQGSLDKNGNLQLFANLYVRKGVDTILKMTNRNTELGSPRLQLQGTISNYVIGYSQAQTAQTRVMAETFDQDSIDDYGYLELNQVYIGRHDLVTVQNATRTRLDNRSRPVMRLTRNALDNSTMFNYLNVGNVVRIVDTQVGFNENGGFGFDKQFKILSMEYNDMSNKVPLVIEEV